MYRCKPKSNKRHYAIQTSKAETLLFWTHECFGSFDFSGVDYCMLQSMYCIVTRFFPFMAIKIAVLKSGHWLP